MLQITDLINSEWAIPEQSAIALFFDGDYSYLHTDFGQTIDLTAQQGQSLQTSLGLVEVQDSDEYTWAIAPAHVTYTRRFDGDTDTVVYLNNRLSFRLDDTQLASIQRPNYGAFRNAMLGNTDWLTIGVMAYNVPQLALAFTCLIAAISQADNYVHLPAVQSLWNSVLTALQVVPTEAAIASWNAIAQSANVRLSFDTDGLMALL